MKLNIHIFRRKQREEAYKGKYTDRIVTEHLEHHGTEPESLHRKKSNDVVGQIAVSLW